MTPLLVAMLAAAPVRVALVPTILGSSEDVLSSVWSEIYAAVRFRRGLELVSEAETFSRGIGLQDAVSACGSDEACFARQLEAVGADFALLVTLDLRTKPAFVGVELFDVRAQTMRASRVADLGPEEGALAPSVGARARDLLSGVGFREVGRLVVSVPTAEHPDVRGPRGSVDPDPDGAFTLDPGEYVVGAVGRDETRRVVRVVAGTETAVQVVLPDPGSFWTSPWPWVVGGVVVVSVAVSVGVAASGQPRRCFCIELPAAPCDGTCD
ncbi:MAG: hypothetical protein HY791_34220 [Deltaproteobacteria bacterium]|nr:hypothetical protein [Deltaproteobacteria bacterium]